MGPLFIVEKSARDAIAARNVILTIGLIADFPHIVETEDFETSVPKFGLAFTEVPLNSSEDRRVAACGQHAIIWQIAPLGRDKRPRANMPKKRAGGKKPR